MTVSNSGYEVQEPSTAQPGLADDWTTTTAGSLEETAEFAGDTGFTLGGYETFEHGWGAADPQIVLSDLVVALIEGLPAEAFERDWYVDQGFMFLAALEAAAFDASTQTVEDFNDDWGTIDTDFLLSGGEVTAAIFDVPPQPLEDFENDWGDVATTMGSTEQALFDAGGLSVSAASPSPAELFVFRARQRVQSDIGPDTMGAVNPPLVVAVGDAVTFVAENGELPEPLREGTTYIVDTLAADVITLVPFAGGATVDITTLGAGANYVVADPGRFWLEEL